MAFEKMPEGVQLQIGAICGPVIAIIDGTMLDHTNICYDDLIQGIPEELLNVTQIMLITSHDQLRKHVACYRKCNFQNIDLDALPEDYLILRAWFPALRYSEEEWTEASISIAGMMVAAKYLYGCRSHTSTPLKMAFWSGYPGFEGWEKFEVFPNGSAFTVRVLREDFKAPDEVYDYSDDFLNNVFFMREKKDKLVDCLRDIHKFKDSGYMVGIAAIGSKNDSESKTLLLPFIPIFMGELHYVFPIGQFLRDHFTQERFADALEEDLCVYENICEAFQDWNTLKEFLEMIGVLTDRWEEQAGITMGSPIRKYPGGWTLFDDESQHERHIHFVTLEPEYPKYPLCSNSCTGALAAAIVQSLLHPAEQSMTYNLKGRTRNLEKTWVERAFSQSDHRETVEIGRNQAGLWEVTAPVRLLAQFKCDKKSLQFVKRGRKSWAPFQ
jgi:hypothetical protein